MLQPQNLLFYLMKQFLKPQQPQVASEAETSKLFCSTQQTNQLCIYAPISKLALLLSETIFKASTASSGLRG